MPNSSNVLKSSTATVRPTKAGPKQLLDDNTKKGAVAPGLCKRTSLTAPKGMLMEATGTSLN